MFLTKFYHHYHQINRGSESKRFFSIDVFPNMAIGHMVPDIAGSTTLVEKWIKKEVPSSLSLGRRWSEMPPVSCADMHWPKRWHCLQGKFGAYVDCHQTEGMFRLTQDLFQLADYSHCCHQ